jgi:hypothetical protein
MNMNRVLETVDHIRTLETVDRGSEYESGRDLETTSTARS